MSSEQNILETKILDNEHNELKRVLEALFFVASEPLPPEKLQEITNADNDALLLAASELIEEYSGKGFQLRMLAGGYQFFTPGEYAPYIEKLYRPKAQQLSRAAMETLAIIAYKQPITRGEIAAIRQVAVDGIVTNLLEKNLIKEVGRRLTLGRPVLYGTTQEFLMFFGLNDLSELPDVSSFLAEENNL
jgi:segregation and condensation protein B